MKIEILYSEVCNLYGDRGNITLLENCFDKKDFVYTSLNDEPYFVKHDVSLIYMGPMSESIQEKVITKLNPYKKRIKELIDSKKVFIFTGNAMEVLGKEIITEDNKKIKALDIFDIVSKRHPSDRYNSLVLAKYEDTEIVGYISQSSTPDIKEEHLFEIIKDKKDSKYEGIHYNNFYGTCLLGPILVLNPLFTKKILKLIGYKNKIKYEEDLIKAYEKRLEEYKREEIKY